MIFFRQNFLFEDHAAAYMSEKLFGIERNNQLEDGA